MPKLNITYRNHNCAMFRVLPLFLSEWGIYDNKLSERELRQNIHFFVDKTYM